MRHRVDNVPWLVRPFYLSVTWVCGLILYSYYSFCRLTSRVILTGPGIRDLSQHAIFCMWHESWLEYLVVFLRYRRSHAMITHPDAYMKPVHNVFRWMGIKRLLLGSSGTEGRQAVNELAQLVRDGCSSTISPDGPYGPPRILKKGVLHLALRSGAPVVPLTISSSRFIALPSWDAKRLPLPFSRIRVTIHEPMWIDQQNFGEIGMRIVAALGGAGSPDSARF